MAHMNVFQNDAFTMRSLTNALEHMPHNPQRLGQLELFQPRPIRTTGFTVEEKTGILSIIPTTQRGEAPVEQEKQPDRVARYINTPRLAQKDTLFAHEVQDWRAFGTESELAVVMREVSMRMDQLRMNLELTREHHRMGAIQGQVLDADGVAVLYDWFDIFNITAEAIVNFAWPTAVADEGIIRKLANEILRTMMRNSRGAWIQGQTRIHAMCGDDFYDDLTQNKETRNTYLQQGELGQLTDDFGAFEQFRYGGITWENYRGTDDGTTVAIPADECRFFPVGGNNIFQVVQSPAEFFDFVNAPGQAEYAMQIPDRDRNAHTELELYAYPAYMPTRPKMLMSGRTQP